MMNVGPKEELNCEDADDRRSLDTILNELAPAKSAKEYAKAWETFTRFLGHQNCPSETEYLQFFDHLRRHRDYKASTFWSLFSKLNSMHQRKFGERLQAFPRIKILLKSYEQGYTRKVARIFSLSQIHAFMRQNLEGPYWLLRKAFVALAFCGGLRCEELHKLNQRCYRRTQEGYFITFIHAKQVGEQKSNEFLVPFNSDDQCICFASKLHAYLLSVTEALGPFDDKEPLFFGCFGGKKFVRQPLGKRYMQQIGKDVANVLNMEHPNSYTGHCWRRSAATEAAGNGATSADLKRTFGWKQESTSLRYLDHTEKQAVKMASLLTGCGQHDQNSEANVSNHAGKENMAPDKVRNNSNVQHIYNITMGNNCTINL